MFNPFSANEVPGAGKFLISEPFQFDENFKRSVILLCEHTTEGSVGFILNKQLDICMKDVLDIETFNEIPLYLGGPVQHNTLHYIHCDENLKDEAKDLGNGLFWGGNFDHLSEMLENNTLDVEKYRFFLGYSGWGSGQLQAEMDENSWLVMPADTAHVFQQNVDYEELWKEVLREKGGVYKIFSNYPESPQLN